MREITEPLSLFLGMSGSRTERDPIDDPDPGTERNPDAARIRNVDLGNGSEVQYMPRFISSQDSWNYFKYLHHNIPWTRPTIRVFGRSHLQVVFESRINKLHIIDVYLIFNFWTAQGYVLRSECRIDAASLQWVQA